MDIALKIEANRTKRLACFGSVVVGAAHFAAFERLL